MSKVFLLAASIAFGIACAAHRPCREAAASTGIVVDESGTPLPGVRYWLSGFEERTAEGWRVAHFSGLAEMRFTAEDGRFEVPQREGLRCDVDFDLTGFVPAFVQELEPGQVIRVSMQRGLDVRGRAPEGSRVAIRRPNPRGLWFQTEVVTDPSGEFVFRGILPKAPPVGGPSWQLVCSGASFDLPARVDGPIDDIRIDVAIGRGH